MAGVKVSTGAYVLSLLRPRIIRDLRLEQFGLEVITKDPGLFVPFGNGRSLYIWSDLKKTQKEIEKFSRKDALAYEKWLKFWDPFYELADLLMLSPHPLGMTWIVSSPSQGSGSKSLGTGFSIKVSGSGRVLSSERVL